ncbi:MAG TPA: hypothetical protein VNH21_12955 [Steroidobacteraceae bacterium]|nr:hypothetical protein [Steroidobacteraceae bacterium]
MKGMVDRLMRVLFDDPEDTMSEITRAEGPFVIRQMIAELREPGFAICSAQTVVTPGQADLIWKQMIDAMLEEE